MDFDKAANFGAMKTFCGQPRQRTGTTRSARSGSSPRSSRASTRRAARPPMRRGRPPVLHGATQKQKRPQHLLHAAATAATVTRGWGGTGMGTATTTVGENTVGTLVVDIFDVRPSSSCSAARLRTSSRTRRTRTPRSWPKASDKMFKEFPRDRKPRSRAGRLLAADRRAPAGRPVAPTAAGSRPCSWRTGDRAPRRPRPRGRRPSRGYSRSRMT